MNSTLSHNNPTVLIILDGFGWHDISINNAIAQAHTPFLSSCISTYPYTLLKASGASVGLLPGMNGNSEVGHLTMGTGRIIKQPIVLLHERIADGSFFNDPLFEKYFSTLRARNRTLHIMGLLSDGNIHSNLQQFFAFIKVAIDHNVSNIVVHPFLDGRDVAPQSATLYLEQLTEVLHNKGTIGSIHGRFYAMDRDHNWERTCESYRVLTTEETVPFENWRQCIDYYYAQNITDEFIPPTTITAHRYIKQGDGIIFCNIRPDRARQLTTCFVNPSLLPSITQPVTPSFFITPVRYAKNLPTQFLLKHPVIKNCLKEVLSIHHKTIFAIAETEKYAHVTYFFDGYKENVFDGETRILIPSIKTDSYAAYPCMSAPVITDTIIHSLQTDPADFYLINYANADMVGHSGNMSATVAAIECLDKQLARLYAQIQHMNGIMYITADHGKAEIMKESSTGQPRTAHTTSCVPFLVISNQKMAALNNIHTLSDIAPYILTHMRLPIPEEMDACCHSREGGNPSF